MKRTDKYRDSYKYDNQYQNHKDEQKKMNIETEHNLKIDQTLNDQINIEITEALKMNRNVTTMAVTIVGNSN